MANLSARFADAATAQRVVDHFVTKMGAAPALVTTTREGGRTGPETDVGTEPGHPVAVPTAEVVRVAIYDTAIDTEDARRALERAGGTDIQPIQQ
jgi:hypothetical protein